MAADASVNFSLLNRTCKLVVLLCFLHISVTLFFYVRSYDVRLVFTQNQQHSPRFFPGSNQSLQTRGPPRSLAQGPPGTRTLTGRGTEAPPKTEPERRLDKCPETSPLLGESQGFGGCDNPFTSSGSKSYSDIPFSQKPFNPHVILGSFRPFFHSRCSQGLAHVWSSFGQILVQF